jgi:hypothetical protein
MLRQGDLKYNMTNVPVGTIYCGSNGEMLKYQLINYGTSDSPNWYLLQWNSSYVVTKDKIGMAESWGSQIQGVSYNATERGYDLNVSISTPLTGSILTVFPLNRVIVGLITVNGVSLSAISLKSGEEGRLLFQNVFWPAPNVWQTITVTGSSQSGWAAFSQEDMVAVYWTKENRVNYAFSLETGQFYGKQNHITMQMHGVEHHLLHLTDQKKLLHTINSLRQASAVLYTAMTLKLVHCFGRMNQQTNTWNLI